MIKNIEEVEFTIFDTETTGLSPLAGDRIVEIAAIRVKGDEKLASFESLVNPGREISPGAFAVNKITAEMLQGAPIIETVMPKFIKFTEGSFLCAYNSSFDLGFLNNELELIHQNKLDGLLVIDILQMARRLLPALERHALWFVAEKLGLKSKQQHRALSDVELTRDVFNKLKEILRSKDIHSLAALSCFLGTK